MDFVERIRRSQGLNKKQFAERLGMSRQAYNSLRQATERLSLKDIVALRKESGLDDTALLDEIEREFRLQKRRRNERS